MLVMDGWMWIVNININRTEKENLTKLKRKKKMIFWKFKEKNKSKNRLHRLRNQKNKSASTSIFFLFYRCCFFFEKIRQRSTENLRKFYPILFSAFYFFISKSFHPNIPNNNNDNIRFHLKRQNIW